MRVEFPTRTTTHRLAYKTRLTSASALGQAFFVLRRKGRDF